MCYWVVQERELIRRYVIELFQKENFSIFIKTNLIETDFLDVILNHETVIWIGIIWNNISCYMCDSACRWLIENAKIFWYYVNFPTWKKLLNYEWFLDQDNKMKLVPASFSYFLELLLGKNNLKSVVVINNRFNLSFIIKLMKLFYLHYSCKKVVEQSKKENFRVIENTLPSKSGNLESITKWWEHWKALGLICTHLARICWGCSKSCFVFCVV